MSGTLIGIDVGGTNFRLGVVQDKNVVWEKRFHADFSGLCSRLPPQQALEAILRILQEAIAEARAAYPSVSAIGMGFPGFIEPQTRRLLSSPNMPNLRNADFVTPLHAQCGLPVVLENDASAAAYGEYVLSGKIKGDLVYIGLGTGVGGGLVLQGKLHGGVHGVAMEIGHLIVEPEGRLCGCGNRGCLEQYASTNGVIQSYAARTGITSTALEVAQLAAKQDTAALGAYEQAGTYLAIALAHIAKVVDVQEVVIGGGMSESWGLMQPAFDQRLRHDLIPALRGKLQVRTSQARDQAGIIGTAILAGEAA